MILVDTGYLLALFNPRDQFHSRASKWAMSLNDYLVVTDYVFVEAANALSSNLLRQRSYTMADVLETDPQFQLMTADPLLWHRGMSLYRNRSDKQWSLTDCISFALMKQLRITQALAHDHHFTQAGFDALLRRDP